MSAKAVKHQMVSVCSQCRSPSLTRPTDHISLQQYNLGVFPWSATLWKIWHWPPPEDWSRLLGRPQITRLKKVLDNHKLHYSTLKQSIWLRTGWFGECWLWVALSIPSGAWQNWHDRAAVEVRCPDGTNDFYRNTTIWKYNNKTNDVCQNSIWLQNATILFFTVTALYDYQWRIFWVKNSENS